MAPRTATVPQRAASRDGREMDRRRVWIEGVSPEINGGRFAAKRTVGEPVVVEADVFGDGHDAVACAVLYRHERDTRWREVPMAPLGNDRWRASFVVDALGRYVYTIEGWPDPLLTWRQDLVKRLEAGQANAVDLLIGAQLVDSAAARAAGADAERLRIWAQSLRGPGAVGDRATHALDDTLATLARGYTDRQLATRYPRELAVIVDRERARYSAWYEIFPRSCSPEPGRPGTLRDCEARLDYLAAMGFDVVYLPPIHPVGRTFRKGRNNAVVAEPGDVGSPWAIGGPDGGHMAVHPELGTIDDLDRLVAAARRRGLEVALDVAFQCTPDHPWVTEHPDWFRTRPDGTIQYAENPPKKYQDIYPLNFDTADWMALWRELEQVFRFWIAHDVKIFRVDNPHTKPFRFWEWVIAAITRDHPDVIFLSEAFTRPKVMFHLAKLGFTQSYTYFTWRATKRELTEYFTELTRTEVREFFRPALWPNTPDILSEYLQYGGRPAFIARLVLAATLGASYGIYGPAFELVVNQPREPGSEEYLYSEKYEIKHWDLDAPWSLREIIARVNQARRDNAALQSDWRLQFHRIDNDQILCYSKTTPDYSNAVIVVVTLDYTYTQSGWVALDLAALGLDPHHPFQVHDLLTDARYIWHGSHNYVELNPHRLPAHLFRVRRKMRSEQDFDYFL